MIRKALLAATLIIPLSGCVTLYSTSHNWQLPGELGGYVLTAQMSVGLLMREATISVNGKPLLSGQSFFWTDVITMEGTLEGLPIIAVCTDHAKQCDVTIAGLHATTLDF